MQRQRAAQPLAQTTPPVTSTTGKWAITPQFASADAFSEGLASVQIGDGSGRRGYIDKQGRVVIAPQFTLASSFSEGLAAVVLGIGTGTLGYIDKYGTMAIAPQFRDARAFSDGRALIQDTQTGNWGYIDRHGAIVITPRNSIRAGSFGDGLAPFQIADTKTGKHGQGKWGYIDTHGTMVLTPQFGWAMAFSEGLAGVSLGYDARKYGYIDRSGKVVIKPQFVSRLFLQAWPCAGCSSRGETSMVTSTREARW